jgi:hypothetical protein
MAAAAPSWNALLQSGNYSAAFQAANQAGELSEAINPTTLAQLYPKGMTEAQYQSFYSAFAPYEAQMAGSTVPQGEVGGDANLEWQTNLTPQQIQGDAAHEYEVNSALAAAQSDQAALDKLGPIVGGTGFGMGPNAAQTAAQDKLSAATNAYDAISGNQNAFGTPGVLPTSPASNVADVLNETGQGGLTTEKPDKSFYTEFTDAGGPISIIAAIAAPELIPEIAAAAGGGAAATIAAGAAFGAGTGALEGEITGGDVGKDALIGGITGAAGSAGPAISSATGGAVSPGEAGFLAKTAGGAITGGATGAEDAAIAGGVGYGLQSSGITGALESDLGSSLGGSIAKTGGGILSSEIDSSLAPKYLGSTESSTGVTSPTGGSMASPSGAQNVAIQGNDTDVGGSDLTSLNTLTGLSTDPTLGMGSDPTNMGYGSTTAGSTGGLSSLLGGLGGQIGGLAPYLAVGGLGLLEQQQAASTTNSEVNQLEGLGTPLLNEGAQQLGAYQSGTLTPAQSAVSNNAIKSGNTLLTSAAPLSGIAATAFQQYQSGTLPAWQQTQLDQSVAAQKQQVAQSLASQGITDSSVLQAQYQQIDAQAAITKGQLNQQNFATGNQAYDSWLQSTTEGQQMQQQGLQYAAQSLQQDFANALGADSLGGQDVQSAVQLAVQSNTQLAEMMTNFMGSLATAYAISVGGTKSGTTGTSIPGLGTSTNPTLSVGGASTPGSLPAVSDTLDAASAATNTSGNAAMSTDFNDPNLAATLNNPATNSYNDMGQLQMGGSYDAYQGGTPQSTDTLQTLTSGDGSINLDDPGD